MGRASLHNGALLLLDEPRSNVDSLNEAALLKVLKEERRGRTVVLVSHRRSTMNIADEVMEADTGRIS